MMRHGLIHAIALVAALVASSAKADLQEITPPASMVEAIKARYQGNLDLVGYFQGPANLIGVAGRIGGKLPLVFFTDESGKWMVFGYAIDTTTGRNLVQDASARYFPNDKLAALSAGKALPSPAKSQFDMKAISKLAFVEEGKKTSPAVAYVFFDFDCKHCQSLYAALRDKAGSIKGHLRWVPIALSGSTLSESKASAALSGMGIAEAMGLDGPDIKKMTTRNTAKFAKAAMALDRNMAFAKGRIRSTPFIVFERDGVVYEHAGYSNTDTFLSELNLD